MEEKEIIIARSETSRNTGLVLLSLLFIPIGFLIAATGIASLRGGESSSGFLYVLGGGFCLVAGIGCFSGLRAAQRVTITVSNKSVYGQNKSGGAFSVPIDSITNVYKVNGGIGFSTSSQNYAFSYIKNFAEIYDAINGQLRIRQQKAKTETSPVASRADELEKFKGLLDKGVITQEEFDAKKKQLLGL